jgi:membrane associated rhomboid family serine protease
MLIIPVGRKPDWRHPPVITLLLILANCVVYFGIQSKDYKAEEQAANYYFTQGLAEIELPRYEDFLRKQGETARADKIKQMLEHNDFTVYRYVTQDALFNQALHEDKIINEQQHGYFEWKRHRIEFELLQGSRFNERFAFSIKDMKPVTFLSHMFMHANFGHLFGNMLMLLLVGYIVEDAIGGAHYLLFYLLGGIGAVSVFAAAGTDADIGLIGASGAIASVMGMYTVLFGLRKIEFFYWILIYFDFARLPAIALLPVWVGNEIYQKLTTPYSNVAYMAHAGGLLTGALLIYLEQRFRGKTHAQQKFAREDQQSQYQRDLESANALLQKLDIKRALQAYFSLLEKNPGNLEILYKLYGITKNQPASEDYQKVCAKIFTLSENSLASATLQAQAYQNATRAAKSLKLSLPQALELQARFITHQQIDQAEHLMAMLLQKGADDPRIPGMLLAIIKQLNKSGQPDRAANFRKWLQQLFPNSQEAQFLKNS